MSNSTTDRLLQLPFEMVSQWIVAEEPRVSLATKISYVRYTEREELFEPPTLLGQSRSQPEVPILLVSAGAAVGKSMLAKQIAAGRCVVYCDLSQINVGAQTFQGLLLTAFGADGVADAIKQMRAGKLAVVLDALDEAQARAGDDNFVAFLQDIVDYGPLDATRPVLMLLGRAETVDRVAALFESRRVGYSRVEVDYFGEQAALRFISKYLDALHPDGNAPHRKHEQPFEDAKLLIFDFLTSAIASAGWTVDVTRSLLGYAPVLQGIASFLDTENFSELASRFTVRAPKQKASPASRSPWSILPQIVERILDREQRKFIQGAKGSFGDLARRVGFTDWRSIYDPDEQLRLVVEYLRDPKPLPKPDILPESLYGAYAETLLWLLPQHPFIGRNSDYANVLFAEYVRAWMICKRAVKSHTHSSVAEDGHFGPGYLPSPLLSHLVLLQQNPLPPVTLNEFQNLAASARPLIPPQYMGVWYESFLAGRGQVSPFLWLVPWDAAGRTIGFARDPVLGVKYYFWTSGEETSITFRRLVQYVNVDTNGGVLFGGDGPTITIGPNVRVMTEWIEFDSREVRIKPGDGVVLRAGLLDYRSAASPNVRVLGDGPVDFWWPQMRYPWQAFKSTKSRSAVERGAKVRLRLGAILGQLRPLDWLSDRSRRDDELFLSQFESRDPNDIVSRRVIRLLVELGLFAYRRGYLSASRERFAAAGFNLTLLAMPASDKRGEEYWLELDRLYTVITEQAKMTDGSSGGLE